MYQDKIEKEEAKEAIANSPTRSEMYNVFIRAKLQPLDFETEEEGNDAAHIARDILSKRTNDEIILLSRAIDSMLGIGQSLLSRLSLKLLRSTPTRTAVALPQGKSLYLLFNYFDLTTIGVKKVQWCEMLATLTLMQVAKIVEARHTVYGESDMAQAMKEHSNATIQYVTEEIWDSIARAECLFDIETTKKRIAISGGKGKAKNIQPLKDKVIKLYLNEYNHLNNKRAGKAIFNKLQAEEDSLLLSSYAEDKDLQFSKWITLFLDNELNISFDL